jgi:hypothetical protein
MVHLSDEGSEFDAPIEKIWQFLQAPEDHARSHTEHKNQQAQPVGDASVRVSWEQDMDGKEVKVVNRITMFPPLGVAIEVLEGPLAGSKFFNFYTPKGGKTAVTIVGNFVSPTVPETHLEPMVRKNLEHVFAQDSAAIKKFQASK